MNRYEAEGVTRDLIAGKCVLVIELERQQPISMRLVLGVLAATTVAEPTVYRGLGCAGIDLEGGGRLVFGTHAGLRGRNADVVLDKVGVLDQQNRALVATSGGEVLR